jgi:flagella basal body P-ring formation protein FlgA
MLMEQRNVHFEIRQLSPSLIKKIILCMLLILTCVSLSGITLYMKEIVPVEDKVFLGDLVTIKDAPRFLAAQIRKYPLPLSGRNIHIIPSRYIRDLASRFTKQSVIITGTKTTLIPIKLEKEMGQRYIKEFIPVLITGLCKKDNRVEIDIISAPTIPGKKNSYAFRLSHTREYLGYVTGKLEVEQITGELWTGTEPEPGNSTEIGVWVFHVYQHIPVIKAKQGLKKNQDLSWDDLFIAEEKLSPYKGELFLPGEPVEGYKTIKELHQGETLYSSFIRKSLKVRAGEKVFITLQKGTIRLSMTGRAGDSGSIGDMVKVRPSQSNEWVTGMVTGRGEVRIEL